MKTVIFVWTQKFNINQEHLKKYNYYNETNFFFGLGDLIRASVKMYNLSKSMNFKLIIDIQLHPISFFLKNSYHTFTDLVYKNKDNVDYVCYGAVEDYINNKSNIMFMFTNDFYEGEITEDCKKFIKNLLTPIDKYQQFIEQKISTIPYKNYNILHFRLDDSEFLNKGSDDVIFDSMLSYLKDKKENNDVFITDRNLFKKYVFLNDDIFMFDTKICHLGLSTNIDEIRDTLFDFFLIINSSKIKTYCKIHEISGFVKWIHKIYDIPIEKL